MKVRITNNGSGPYGVELVGGGYKFIGPGKERTADAATPGRLYEIDFLDVEAVESQVPEMPASLKASAAPVIPTVAEVLGAEVVPDPFDHDRDGKPGGSPKGKTSTAAKGARRRRRKAATK